MKIVQVEGLTKKYGDTVAVDIISLGIHEGEIFGLLGPNGTGKSTAIHMISGLLPIANAILSVSVIEGDEIYLKPTKAKVVRSNHVIIGQDATLGLWSIKVILNRGRVPS